MGPELAQVLVSDVDVLKQLFQEYFEDDLNENLPYSLLKSFAVIATRTNAEFKELSTTTPITALQKSLRKQM